MPPTDRAACPAIIRDLAERVTRLEAGRDAALQFAFRKKVERYMHAPNRFVLDFGSTPAVVDAAEGMADAALETVDGYERRKPAAHKTRNEQLPAHPPRYEVILAAPAATKARPTHGERRPVGMDWQETLEVEPPKLVVRRTGIPEYARVKAPECGVVEAARPVGLVEGNRCGARIVARVMVGKYAYHTPVCRQQDIFAASGWTPARGTSLNLPEAAARLIRPLVAHLREVVRGGSMTAADDTTVTLTIEDSPLPKAPNNPKNARANSAARPIWERMRETLASDAIADVRPKESFGQALTYPRDQFDDLLVCLDDGLMPIDDSETEQLMKQVALGRRNSGYSSAASMLVAALPIS